MSVLVVADPGHGGDSNRGGDPGNVNNGRQEKDYTLSVSLLFKGALERNGVPVKMTRETDVFIGLSERAQFANNLNANLFVSWHNDSIDKPDVLGATIHIYPSAKGTETEVIAKKVINAICAATGQANRGVKYSDFAVVRETTMAAMLIEGGFNTNTAESAKLADVAFQKLQAEAAAKAICEHYGMQEALPVDPQPEDQVSDWAKSAWEKAIKKGIIKGDGKIFNPQANVSREALVVILDRLGLL